jgi:hypothetical protein
MRKHRVNTEKLRKCQNCLNFTTNPHTSVYCTVYYTARKCFLLSDWLEEIPLFRKLCACASEQHVDAPFLFTLSGFRQNQKQKAKVFVQSYVSIAHFVQIGTAWWNRSTKAQLCQLLGKRCDFTSTINHKLGQFHSLGLLCM